MAWSDGKKWFLDIVKSLIVFGVIAILTAIVIDTYSDISEARKSRESLKVARIASVAEGLEKASSFYFAVAHDAFADKCSDGSRNAIRKYEDEGLDNWKLQLRRVQREAPFLETSIVEVKKVSENMHTFYNACNEGRFNTLRKEARDSSYEIVSKLFSHYESCWSSITKINLFESVVAKITGSNKATQPTACSGG
ncbi:MAG: hypothetical protein ABW139_19190 [Candidatus Thiodiazotropha sp. DIVDIV]